MERGEEIMAKRASWMVDITKGIIRSSTGFKMSTTTVTEKAWEFLRWYGLKQWLSDKTASIANPSARVKMQILICKRLSDKKFRMIIRDTGTFTWDDPGKEKMSPEERAARKLKRQRDKLRAALEEEGLPKEFINKAVKVLAL